MHAKNVPSEFWAECIKTAAHIINRLPQAKLGFISPYLLLWKIKPPHLNKGSHFKKCSVMYAVFLKSYVRETLKSVRDGEVLWSHNQTVLHITRCGVRWVLLKQLFDQIRRLQNLNKKVTSRAGQVEEPEEQLPHRWIGIGIWNWVQMNEVSEAIGPKWLFWKKSRYIKLMRLPCIGIDRWEFHLSNVDPTSHMRGS